MRSTQSRTRWRCSAAVAAALSVACGCNALVGLHDPVQSVDAGDATDGGDDVTSPTPEAGPAEATLPDVRSDVGSGVPCGEGLSVCSNACVNIATDRYNCGRCAHDCKATPCVAGLCQVGQLTNGEPVRGVVAVLGGIVWMTDHGVFSASIRGNGAIPVPILLVVVDGGPVRAFLPPPSLPTDAGVAVAVAPGDTILGPGELSPIITTDAGDPVSFLPWSIGYLWASSDPSANAIMYGDTQSAPQPFVALTPGSRPCSLLSGSAGVYWTSAYGTFFMPYSGTSSPVRVTTNAFDFALAQAYAGMVVAENGGTFDLALYTPQTETSLPALTTLVAGANARSVVADGTPNGPVYFASEGIYRTDSTGSTPVLVAGGGVSPECHAPQMALSQDGYVLWVDRDTQQVMYVAQ
jgi:hypothetical protein